MADAPLLDCRGISKSFAQVHALTNVDFEVRRGEVMALVASGRLEARVDRTLPLEAAAEAHTLVERRAVVGRVVLVPGDA